MSAPIITKNNIKVSLCSIPVEAVGSRLDRKRSEGSLGIVPKVAIVSLVKAMKMAGYSEQSYDFYDIDMLYPSDDEIRTYFSKYTPNVVGLSAVVSTSYSQVERIASIIRDKNPNAWIIMGGNLAACSEAVLKHTEVDLSVVGDGEVAWIEILNYIVSNPDRKNKNMSKLMKINGVAFLDGINQINLNGFGLSSPQEQMPYPDYKLLESGLKGDKNALNNYFRPGLNSGWFDFDERAKDKNRGKNIAGIFTSKGCVAKCTFCQRSTKGYKTQPLEGLEDHLIYVRDNFDVGFIRINDENFGSDKKHSYQLAKILNKVGMLWFASGVRCTSTNEEDIKFYKDHGCSALKYGVESGSQKMLDIMEKVFKVSDIYNALDSCIRQNVFSPATVLVGMPGETESTARETGKFIGDIASKLGVHPNIIGFDIFYALPLPGTPLWEYGEQMGIIGTEPNDVVDYLTNITDATIYKRYYINLNGAPISEVLFWEYIVRLEASRSYRKNKSTVLKNDLKDKYINLWKKRELANPRYSLKYSALKFTIVSYFIDTYVVGNKVVDKIPRVLVYPIIKYFLYFEYLAQKMYGHNTKNNIFIKRKSIKRVANNFSKDSKSNKKKSLRGVVLKNRNKIVGHIDNVRQVLKTGL
jgi:anaerobic magnesium-protoporphyrin IX monomethyl ester cyclase